MEISTIQIPGEFVAAIKSAPKPAVTMFFAALRKEQFDQIEASAIPNLADLQTKLKYIRRLESLFEDIMAYVPK